MINELRVGENNFTNHEDIAEGFNEYFSNIGPNLASNIDSSNYNLERMSKMLNQSLLHSMSLIFYMVFPAIKPLELIKFHSKSLN